MNENEKKIVIGASWQDGVRVGLALLLVVMSVGWGLMCLIVGWVPAVVSFLVGYIIVASVVVAVVAVAKRGWENVNGIAGFGGLCEMAGIARSLGLGWVFGAVFWLVNWYILLGVLGFDRARFYGCFTGMACGFVFGLIHGLVNEFYEFGKKRNNEEEGEG
ncbi:hypothetical protein CMI37_16285 [Candidatus Pacearchaeota archaeon]|nr:hypothetical protein [Candidatus Pacearchaeota archaeon]|tara:strand:+ start:4507 stop:4989 length:483 start_codon:yes stop_codon:yes gene_type:complete